MRIDYGRGPEEAVLSVHTLMLYEQEFNGADMIQDYYGLSIARKQEYGDDVETVLDFRNVNWTALVRVLWAALKTADDSLPPFAEWEAGLPDIDLFAVNRELGPEVMRRFFRSLAPGRGDGDE